jgi:hypothetical protein
MDPKELRGLLEAYSEVYAPQEEIGEGMKPLPKEKMARQAQKAQGMENRAAAAGDEKETNRQMQRRIAMQMPSSRRTILDKKKMGEEVEIEEAVRGESSERRKDLAAERRAGHRPLSKKEGDANAAHMARKVRFADKVTKAKGHMPGYTYGEEVEIFDVVLEFLQAEGYAETLEEAEWMMANVIDEEAIEIILGEEQLDELSHDTYRSVAKKQSAKVGALQDAGNYGAADKVQDRLDRTKRLRKKSFVEPKAPGARNPYAEEYMDEGVPLRGTTPDGKPWRVDPSPVGPRQPRKMERDPKASVSPKGGFRDYKQQSSMKKDSRLEAVEYVDEAQDTTPSRGQSKYGRKAPTGYMQTRKPTLQQMSSREKQAFRDRGIGEEYVDEAQEARNNPEKYEREQSKKYAPVRGEKTPMPPRGDKRREDFEKWYAANVR